MNPATCVQTFAGSLGLYWMIPALGFTLASPMRPVGGLSAFRHGFGPTCASIWGKIRRPHQRSYRDWRRWKHKRCLSELQIRFDTPFLWHQAQQNGWNGIDLHQAISICQAKSLKMLKAPSLASCPIQLWLKLSDCGYFVSSCFTKWSASLCWPHWPGQFCCSPVTVVDAILDHHISRLWNSIRDDHRNAANE